MGTDADINKHKSVRSWCDGCVVGVFMGPKEPPYPVFGTVREFAFAICCCKMLRASECQRTQMGLIFSRRIHPVQSLRMYSSLLMVDLFAFVYCLLEVTTSMAPTILKGTSERYRLRLNRFDSPTYLGVGRKHAVKKLIRACRDHNITFGSVKHCTAMKLGLDGIGWPLP